MASAAGLARPSLKNAMVATIVMLCSLTAGWWLTPKRYWADELGRPDLEEVIPRQFGDWVASDKTPPLMVDPELAETLRVTYSQTLSRIYVNGASGRIIMLSVAHGVDQSGKTQLHLPEACYATQGFIIDSREYDTLASAAGAIQLTRFTSHAQARKEAVSYWVRIGRRNIRGALEKNVARLDLAARGYIADGVLFRVSELSPDAASSFRLQDQFMNELITAVTPAEHAFLVGGASAS